MFLSIYACAAVCVHACRYVSSGHFFRFKILNFNIFLGYQKNEYFLDMKIFWTFFLGSSQNWASFRFISMHYRVFFKVKGTEFGYFLGC